MELVEALIALPHLEGLGIDFHNGNAPDWRLEMPQASLIYAFELRGPKFGPKILSKIAKPGVQFVHSRLYTEESANPLYMMGLSLLSLTWT